MLLTPPDDDHPRVRSARFQFDDYDTTDSDMLLTLIPHDQDKPTYEFALSLATENDDDGGDTWDLYIQSFSDAGQKFRKLYDNEDVTGWQAVVSEDDESVVVSGEIIGVSSKTRKYKLSLLPTLPPQEKPFSPIKS